MPYIVRPRRSLSVIAACGALLLLSAGPALAAKSKESGSTQTSEITSSLNCAEPTLYQPFLGFGDSNYYALPAGESYDNFTGQGWVLSGGARFIQTTLYDGATGYVLDMPANSTATSPNFCLNPEYPKARAMIADVFGPPNLSFYVTYAISGQTPSSKVPAPSGNVWQLSPTFSLYPSSTPGWQLGKFTFVAGSNASEVRVSNFYVDPYRR
jgi:hypothetical protein